MKDWNLTSKQKKVAELIAVGNPETFEPYTKVQICEETETPRSTLYEWLKNPEFTAYVEYVSDVYLRSRIPDVDKKLINAVLNGQANSRLMETFYKRLGKLKDSVRQEVTIEESKTMSNMSADEMDKRIEELKRQAGLDT